MAYQVLIADDYRMIRQMLEMTIAHAAEFELAGRAANAAEAIRFCRNTPVDLVIMDVVMGLGMDGIDAAAEIKRLRPGTKILIITSMAESTYLTRARESGADSFWHKEVQEQPLLDVMRRTMAGESVYPDGMPEVWLGQTVSTELTPRELDVLRGLVGGSTNGEIAAELGISERTVKQHVTDMLNKTGFKSRLQLAVQARGGGLVINDQEE
ncbi:MAG: response regulator transcription factor [Oscillospiraceae bacterium]|nr:response regulator transcription factor [Oscillospiraceae bacterium]